MGHRPISSRPLKVYAIEKSRAWREFIGDRSKQLIDRSYYSRQTLCTITIGKIYNVNSHSEGVAEKLELKVHPPIRVPSLLWTPSPAEGPLVSKYVNLCSRNSPYSLNCHVGAMLVFRMLCRITQSSDAHRTESVCQWWITNRQWDTFCRGWTLAALTRWRTLLQLNSRFCAALLHLYWACLYLPCMWGLFPFVSPLRSGG